MNGSKVAVAVWNGRVAPVFDVSREALILNIVDRSVESRCVVSIDFQKTDARINCLLDAGVETLICGAVSEQLLHEMRTHGIEIIGFVAGEIEKVIESFLKNALPTPALSMPGCKSRHVRTRGGRGGKRSCGNGNRRNSSNHD